MANYNEKTGTRYGYISANLLDPEVVDSLMFEHGKDLYFEEYIADLEKLHGDGFDECRASEDYQQDEPIVEGEYEGVKYISSWLGGALHFFIIESPVKVDCALCSPCVPGAGDLGTLGEYGNFAYGVPEDWKAEEY